MERLSIEEIKEILNRDWSEMKAGYFCINDFRAIEQSMELLDELKAYRDAEEQGLLLRLPCKVGDTVYLVDFEEMAYDEATVWSIEIDTKDNRILINSDYEVGTWAEDGYVFYSREEAEAKLAEMQKGN